MPTTTLDPSALDSLQRLTQLVEHVEGFPAILAALARGRSATIDGAWGSSATLASAALARHAPRTLLVVLAHPRDVDAFTEELSSFLGARPFVFPAVDELSADAVLDEPTTQRLRLLRLLQSEAPPRVIVTTLPALIQPVPDRTASEANRRLVASGSAVDPEELASWLVERGYRRTEAVELPGEFSRRGGILDVYPPDAEAPYRLEFFGDDVDSIRQFAPNTQRSLGTVTSAELTAVRAAAEVGADRGHFCDYLAPESWIALLEPGELHEQGKLYLERMEDPVGLFSLDGVFQQLLRFPSVHLTAMPASSVEAICHLRVESVERFSGDVSRVREDLDQIAQARGPTPDYVLIACQNEAEQKRLGDVLSAGKLAETDHLRLVAGRVRSGFRIVDVGVVVLGSQELFHREEARALLPRRRLESRAIDSFLDLNEGDLVVHVSHGIARYHGMQVLTKNGRPEEHLLLEFRDGVRVYVPSSKIDLVQKYVGGGTQDPELSKLGGTAWQNRKEKVEAAVQDLAAEMLQLQALRESRPGTAYPPDTEWQTEFEATFPYRETPDQLTTLSEIKRDLERARPMDRLVCGDVGYGKTELAIRAAFKTVDNGRQVAVLVPTTVLAEQHNRTFSQRFAGYPFVVECLSRFRTGAEQRNIVARLAKGGVDVVIGTHRLLSADVKFKDLGLVIIDEEQRFGVEHKERLKRLRETVDVLTLTATPIPRTLHQSLLGIREISNLETPPADRLAIETRIVRWDAALIRHAILRELNREGQVYFVHNRVHDIHAVADKLARIVPEARVVIGHGQMAEGELEAAMVRFVNREADVLLATTIIESGLDIPSANTIFIDQADCYGLADLHQLRGRVGRSKNRAYAYLLVDAGKSVSPQAARRLKAVEEFTELGAGFKIALRDLEIRGAGNILGTQQSGHIASVGYELYCQMLENAVRGMKHLKLRTPLEVTIDLPWPALLPREYIEGQRARIEVYRRLARVRKLERLEDFKGELRDRFGPLPEAAEWLMRLAELRLLAARWQVATIHLEEPVPGSSIPPDVVLGYRGERLIKRLAERSKGRLRVVDDKSAYFRLKPAETDPLPMYEALRRVLRPA